jgi:hypothetical protein
MLDHIFLMLETSSMKESAKIKRIQALRTDEKGTQLAFYEKTFVNQEKDTVRSVLLGLESVILPSNMGDKYVVVSYFGQDFYREVLSKACKSSNLPPMFTRSWIGVEQLAWHLAFNNKLKNRSIEALAEYLEVREIDALWTLYKCYWTLMRRAITGSFLEQQARTHGGPAYEIAQRFLQQF